MNIPCVIDLDVVNTKNDPRTIKERIVNACMGKCDYDSGTLDSADEPQEVHMITRSLEQTQTLALVVERMDDEVIQAIVQSIIDEVMDTM